jgi:phosphinothricin acetyltransferase
MALTIEPMQPGNWEQVRAIPDEGIRTGHATFETSSPEWDSWDGMHLKSCRLVAKRGKLIAGWAALSPVSERCVYDGVAEVSVYVAAAERGLGVGKALLAALVREAEQAGLWTLQAGIFPENQASIKLHQDCGFREVGRREQLGQLNGVWRDVCLLERRSQVVGT